jgi:hypothetical protein
MRNISLVCVLLGTLWWAQARPAWPTSPPVKSAGDEKQSPPAAATVAPDAAVLTIKGLCTGQAVAPTSDAATTACQTVITRAEFEKLSAAIQGNMTPTSKRQLANSYPRLLVMSHEAEQRGLDKREHFQQMFAYARLQLLSQELVRNIGEQAAQVPDQEIEDYYREHHTAFEKATVERVLVPNIRVTTGTSGGASSKNKRADTARTETEEENKDAMKEAEQLRQRAAAGENFDKLQRAAYDAAGVDSPIPTTKLVNWRRGSLPVAHLSVFDLKVGEISAIISDATGHYIYKLDSKEMESLEEARAEIHSVLKKQRTRDLMNKVQESVATEVNQAYFGSPVTFTSPDPATVTKPDSDKD